SGSRPGSTGWFEDWTDSKTTMTTYRPILRDCALFLLPLVVAGGWVGGVSAAAGVAVAGLVSLGNLRVLAWVVARLAQAMESEHGEGAGLAVGAVFVKSVGALGVYGLLMWLFDPLSVALGLTCVVLGAVTGGLRTAGATEASRSDDTLARES